MPLKPKECDAIELALCSAIDKHAPGARYVALIYEKPEADGAIAITVLSQATGEGTIKMLASALQQLATGKPVWTDSPPINRSTA